MDTTTLRIAAQVLLVCWCVPAAALMVASRRRAVQVYGVRWGVLALACFGAWMFLSAISIKDTAVIPRESIVWLFAMLELGTAAGAWGGLVVYARHNFTFAWRNRTAARG